MRRSLLLTSSAALAVAAGIIALRCIRKRRCRHPSGSKAAEIEQHLRATQRPARLLGIGVAEADERTLSLDAPLAQNHNVHGTAFAGSLFSVGVLCSYYLGREWMRRHGLDATHDLVAKAGSITYRRPVTSETIVATSELPSDEILGRFRTELLREGKASVEIHGRVLQAGEQTGVGERKEKVAVEYSAVVCAFLPRAPRPAN